MSGRGDLPLVGFVNVTFIRDSDSKAFGAVAGAKPYGPTVEITKEECNGHLAHNFHTPEKRHVFFLQ